MDRAPFRAKGLAISPGREWAGAGFALRYADEREGLMKVAVIGRGFGANAMAPAYESNGFAVEIVPSRDREAVAAACRGDADLISVHSPPFQHREHVMQALEAGKDVLCDKPFGCDAAEARAMRDAAQAAGVLHFLNFEFRHGAARAKVRELIAAGAIGTPKHASYSSFAGFLRKRGYGWLNDASLGGGWLGALGSHIIDAMRWQMDSEIVDCGGVLRTEIASRKDAGGNDRACTAEDAFSVWLRLANGATATLDVTSSAPVTLPQRTQFLGTEGAIEVADDKIVTLMKPGAEPEVFDFTPGAGAPAWPALHDWIGVVRHALEVRTAISPDFDDGVACAEVMDKLRAESGKEAA